MQTPQPNSTRSALHLACLLSVTLSHSAWCQTRTGESAQALLEEARKGELDHKIAAKKTEMDRLNEDLNKGKQQADGLQKSIDNVTASVTEATGKLDQLTAQKKRLAQTAELDALRIEAERLKVDGLKLLKTAQIKARDALAKRNEETDLRISLAAAEMKLLSLRALSTPAQPKVREKGAKKPPTPGELRKKLAQAERDSLNANSSAHETMQAASLKLQQADNAAARAKKRAGELGLGEKQGLSSDKDPIDLSAALPGPDDAPAEQVATTGRL